MLDGESGVRATLDALVEGDVLTRFDEGIEPVYITTGGGSDANALITAGLPVVNVANGTERNHQPDESVTEDALERMLDVTLAIVTEAGRR